MPCTLGAFYTSCSLRYTIHVFAFNVRDTVLIMPGHGLHPGSFNVSRRLIDLAAEHNIDARGMKLVELEDRAPNDAFDLNVALYEFRVEVEIAIVRMGNIPY